MPVTATGMPLKEAVGTNWGASGSEYQVACCCAGDRAGCTFWNWGQQKGDLITCLLEIENTGQNKNGPRSNLPTLG